VQSVGSEDSTKVTPLFHDHRRLDANTTLQEMLDNIAAIHSRLYGLTQGTLRNPELPKAYRDGFQVDTQHLTRGLFELASKIETWGQAMVNLEKENADLRKTNNGLETTLETTLTEAVDEVNRMNRELGKEVAKSHRLQEALTKAEHKAREDQRKISVSTAITWLFV
jgi:hypothetical protein